MQHTSLIAMVGKFLLSVLMPVFLSACSTLGYYSQSIGGQISVMSKRVPITDLIEQKDTSEKEKVLLKKILQIRAFASHHLLLPDNQSYSTYVDLEREYVVWNVFAAPEFSLEPISSCFLFVGCLQYRGFFAKQDAIDFAGKLRNADNDVFVGGVAAYSTLGWFDDPILSSMLNYGEFRLAEVIFHELAHQLIYIKDDSAFNEAFATAVGETGVKRWLQKNQRSDDLQKFERDKQWEADFIQLVLTSKEQLEIVYRSELAPDQMRNNKKIIFEQLRTDYFLLKKSWDNPPDYDKWMGNDLNNAKIASVVTYHDLAGSFARLLSLSDNDFPLFYQRVRYLGSLAKDERHRCLQEINNDLNKPPGCYE